MMQVWKERAERAEDAYELCARRSKRLANVAEYRGMMRAAEIAYKASLPFDGEIVAGNIRAAIENAAEEIIR